MNDAHVYRWSGGFGLAAIAIWLVEFRLWTVGGPTPLFSDAAALSEHLASIRVVALTRVLLDMGLYVCLMVFMAGLRHLIRQTRSEYEWLATLIFGSGVVWWAVTLVADSLEGAAVLNTVGGHADPTAVRALVEGTLLIYNGAIAFAVTAFFMACAGFATFRTGALPAWTGWLAYASVFLCVVSIPSMYAGIVDPNGFYNVAGWGPAIAANFPPLFWFLAVSVIMLRKGRQETLYRPTRAR